MSTDVPTAVDRATGVSSFALKQSELRRNVLGKHPILDYIADLKEKVSEQKARGETVTWSGTEMGQGLEGNAAKFFENHTIPKEGDRLGFVVGGGEENKWTNGRILLDTIKAYTESALRNLENNIPTELKSEVNKVLSAKNPDPITYLLLSEQLIISLREEKGFEVTEYRIPDISGYVVDKTAVENLETRLKGVLQKN